MTIARAWNMVVATGIILGVAGSGPAQERGKTSKSKQSTIIQIDVAKLPPDLAKRLIEFALSSGKEGKNGKDDDDDKKGEKKGKK